MLMHAQKAKEIFDDAKQYLHPGKDAVMWDLINGLSELCEALDELHDDVRRVKRAVQQ